MSIYNDIRDRRYYSEDLNFIFMEFICVREDIELINEWINK